MNFRTRIKTFGDRLKYRLTEDEAADTNIDLIYCLTDDPAWPVLQRTMFRCQTSLRIVGERLSAAGVDREDYAMGNVELLLTTVGTFLLLSGLLIAVMAL